MNCITPKVIWPEYKDEEKLSKPVAVPCGKCLACLQRSRIHWSLRLNQEFKHSTSAFFVTLTYAMKDPELSVRDVQLYIKRLRKSEKKKIRYFLVGEHGTKTGRAHYHALIFNTTEKNIRSHWKKGITHVGAVTGASVMYTLKYMVQQSERKPFRLMSRGYGIGAKYLTDEMVAWHRSGDKMYMMVNDVKNPLPRFYKEKIWYGSERERVSDLAKWKSIKARRESIRLYVEIYGKGLATQKLKEMELGVLSRIKVKTEYSQTF